MTESMTFDDYATISEAAALLGIHQESARRLIRRGELAAETVLGRVVVPRDELREFAKTYSPACKSAKARENYAAAQVHMKRKVALGKAIKAIRRSHE